MVLVTRFVVLTAALASASLACGQIRGQADVDSLALPELNQRVLEFVDSHMGRRVGTGECWDLAAGALNAAAANWDGLYGFGRRVDMEQEPVLPGDIIQFEGVVVEYGDARSRTQERMSHHTAIVHAVHGKGSFTLAHQNFGPAGRKVNLTALDVAHIVKGKYAVYRPQR